MADKTTQDSCFSASIVLPLWLFVEKGSMEWDFVNFSRMSGFKQQWSKLNRVATFEPLFSVTNFTTNVGREADRCLQFSVDANL